MGLTLLMGAGEGVAERLGFLFPSIAQKKLSCCCSKPPTPTSIPPKHQARQHKTRQDVTQNENETAAARPSLAVTDDARFRMILIAAAAAAAAAAAKLFTIIVIYIMHACNPAHYVQVCEHQRKKNLIATRADFQTGALLSNYLFYDPLYLLCASPTHTLCKCLFSKLKKARLFHSFVY